MEYDLIGRKGRLGPIKEVTEETLSNLRGEIGNKVEWFKFPGIFVVPLGWEVCKTVIILTITDLQSLKFDTKVQIKYKERNKNCVWPKSPSFSCIYRKSIDDYGNPLFHLIWLTVIPSLLPPHMWILSGYIPSFPTGLITPDQRTQINGNRDWLTNQSGVLPALDQSQPSKTITETVL